VTGAAGVLRPVPVRLRSALVLTLASAAGLAAFGWPLLSSPPPAAAGHTADAPLIFVLTLPVLVLVLLAEISSGGIDAKALALLGVLSAVNAALRPLGAGVAGIETVFFLLVLAGRVFGPGFGFVLGATSLFASALLTAGVGPWLPFQMLAASWVGLGAGLLPRARGRAEIALLAGYGMLAAYAYGLLMNLAFWPYATGPDTGISYVAGAPILDNLQRFLAYSLVTSAAGWDAGRALTNLVAIVLVGPTVLVALRRAARRAAFDAPVSFAPPPPPAAGARSD
jgi:energy-coupling factor transport system substrate-specific component